METNWHPVTLPPRVEPQKPVLDVAGLSVRYGTFTAVDNISFSVQGGEIFGLLGPNGAGKTSTLSAVEGLLHPASGKIMVAGYDLKKETLRAKANMGVQFQATSFQHELFLPEILRLYAALYGLSLHSAEIDKLLQEIGLHTAKSKRYGQLSGGQQQRLSLALSTLHRPALVLLDEPTTGLDPQSRRQLWSRIEDLRGKGHAVVLTTHSMEEAEAVCDRIAIIDHGRLLALDAPQAIVDKYRNMPEVIQASRRGKVTLEDVFIGLTGTTVRS